MLFKSRIQLVLVLFVCGWILVVGRLFHLQVVSAAHYQDVADAKLVHKRRPLEARRGQILDRHGRVLATDEPAWNISLHYDLLERQAPPKSRLRDRLAARFLPPDYGALQTDRDREDASDAARDQLNEVLDALWTDIADSTGHDVGDLEQTAWGHMDKIAAWKQASFDAHQIHIQLAEEVRCHPIVSGLTADEHVAVQRWLTERYGWLLDAGAVQLTHTSRRVYTPTPAMAHILGTQREVSKKDIEARPYYVKGQVADPGGYMMGDRLGATGIESSFESILRGQRGRLISYRNDREDERTDPQPGSDVRLSIDLDLQNAVYDILHAAVRDPEGPDTPGGAVVVVDVATREVLALVSYPSYNLNELRTIYGDLLEDTVDRPLVHRAVSSQYPPGSIIKPITVAAGLDAGVLKVGTTLDCQGRLFPNVNRFKCWRGQQDASPRRHGSITGADALMYSCNVFCYKTAERLRESLGTVDAINHMCYWMQACGIGDPSGAQIEERDGHLPTPEWLKATRENGQVMPADPRNFAIGQGEVEVTPLQAANIVATYTSGVYQPVTLIAGQPVGEPTTVFTPETLKAIRRGMYRVVNSNSGTAKRCKLEAEGYCLCGKSGSAQAVQLITDLTVGCNVEDHESHLVKVRTSSMKDATDAFLKAYPDHERDQVERLDADRWPPKPGGGRTLSHAWFVGFIQPLRGDTPDWRRHAPLAIAVLLEFGDSGGRVAGPVCRDVADMIIADFPQYTNGAGSR